MRRNFNLRKRKSKKIDVLNKKNLSLLFILLFFLTIYIIASQSMNKTTSSVEAFWNYNKEFLNLNNNIPFSINKIILYTNVTANAKTVNFSFANLDISEYCDIGIYLNKLEDNNVSIKSLYIDNISVTKPNIGTPYIYRKKVSELGKSSFSDDFVITDKIDFNIVDSNNIDYNNFEISSDGSTPISIGYYNKDIKTDHIAYIADSNIDGTILKDALIPLSDLYSKFSFTLNIIANNDEHYICNISFDIPVEDQTSTLYNSGYISKEINTNSIDKFIRIK